MTVKLSSNEEIYKPKYVDLLPILVNTFDLYNKDHTLWQICKFADQCEKKFVDDVHFLVDELTNVTMDVIRHEIDLNDVVKYIDHPDDHDEDDRIYGLVHNAINKVLGRK